MVPPEELFFLLLPLLLPLLAVLLPEDFDFDFDLLLEPLPDELWRGGGEDWN